MSAPREFLRSERPTEDYELDVIQYRVMADHEHVGFVLGLANGDKVGLKWDAAGVTAFVIALLEATNYTLSKVDNAGQ